MEANETLPERVAAEIRAEMARQMYNVTDLAAALDISYKAARLRHNGKREFSLTETSQIAEWLNVPVAQFTVKREALAAA